ncbi:MAG TPA: glycosyltransferase [Candidatus Angelobacter sp.]|jgi:glycosyltransferase involved in cell wall biosynthesis
MPPARKRVLFLIPAFVGGVGGSERVIATILRHLDHARFECHLALVQAGNAYLDDIPEEVTVHRLRVSRMRYCLPGIVRLARKIKPQTILSTVPYLNAMSILARPFFHDDVRLLVREAATPSAFLAKDTKHPRLWAFLYRHLYPYAGKVICLSDSMQRDFLENFLLPPEKLIRIYNPVDVEMVERLARSGASPYSTPGPNLVVAGRLRKEKGVDLLLDAMHTVIQKIPSAHLTILGEGQDEAQLKEQAHRLGLGHNVDFLGFVQNPWLYIANADLFILPSRAEGLPNSLLEALALGTPVVASDCVDTMRELQSIDPRIVLFPMEDPAVMSDAIVSALSTWKRNGSHPKLVSRSFVEFDPKHVAEQYSRLF